MPNSTVAPLAGAESDSSERHEGLERPAQSPTVQSPSVTVAEPAQAAGDPGISTVERIARHLEDGIVFGTLAPRERIQELKVAGDLGVSRGSVREALLVMEGRHLVSILPRRGALVRPLNNSELASIAEVIAQVTGTLFSELASRRPTAALLAPLKDGLARINAAIEANDVAELVAARQAFFELADVNIDNDFTADLLRGLSGSARRLMLLASRNPAFDPGDTRRCAQALFDATAAHDGERIRQVLQAMLRRDARLAQG